MGFKSFLINEEANYLGKRVGDVLNATQALQGDMDNVGARHLNRLAEKIVNQIRKLVHGSWSEKQHDKLVKLQKIAVAIQKTIDEKGDLKQLIPAAAGALQKVSTELGVRVNDLDAPEQMDGEDVAPQDFQLTGNGPAPQQPPQQGQPQGQPPAPPPQGM